MEGGEEEEEEEEEKEEEEAARYMHVCVYVFAVDEEEGEQKHPEKYHETAQKKSWVYSK